MCRQSLFHSSVFAVMEEEIRHQVETTSSKSHGANGINKISQTDEGCVSLLGNVSKLARRHQTVADWVEFAALWAFYFFNKKIEICLVLENRLAFIILQDKHFNLVISAK